MAIVCDAGLQPGLLRERHRLRHVLRAGVQGPRPGAVAARPRHELQRLLSAADRLRHVLRAEVQEHSRPGDNKPGPSGLSRARGCRAASSDRGGTTMASHCVLARCSLSVLATRIRSQAQCRRIRTGTAIPDIHDKCIHDSRNVAATCDTDTDGYGSPCDADFNQDFTVSATDFGMFFVPELKGSIRRRGRRHGHEWRWLREHDRLRHVLRAEVQEPAAWRRQTGAVRTRVCGPAGLHIEGLPVASSAGVAPDAEIGGAKPGPSF